jgi:hypothetical protein
VALFRYADEEDVLQIWKVAVDVLTTGRLPSSILVVKSLTCKYRISRGA